MNSAGPAFWASSGVWTWVFATATAWEYGEVIALVLHRPSCFAFHFSPRQEICARSSHICHILHLSWVRALSCLPSTSQ
jgi:hypothetical protein